MAFSKFLMKISKYSLISFFIYQNNVSVYYEKLTDILSASNLFVCFAGIRYKSIHGFIEHLLLFKIIVAFNIKLILMSNM